MAFSTSRAFFLKLGVPRFLNFLVDVSDIYCSFRLGGREKGVRQVARGGTGGRGGLNILHGGRNIPKIFCAGIPMRSVDSPTALYTGTQEIENESYEKQISRQWLSQRPPPLP